MLQCEAYLLILRQISSKTMEKAGFKTKTEKAVELLRSGDFKAALMIFSTFRMGFTKEERRTLQIAKECLTGHDSFYRSLGIDPDAEIAMSKEILFMKYN